MADEIMFGTALIALRSRCGLSPSGLARRLHLPLSTILEWETMQVPPRFIPLVRDTIAAARTELGR
jgi:DNA-binding transcriptional regulator YiaG